MIKTSLTKTTPHLDRRAAEIAARKEAVRQIGDHSLCAWYDRRMKEGGPRPACTDESAACVEQYAQNHGGRLMVTIGPYDFYFADDFADVQDVQHP